MGTSCSPGDFSSTTCAGAHARVWLTGKTRQECGMSAKVKPAPANCAGVCKPTHSFSLRSWCNLLHCSISLACRTQKA